MKQKYNKVKMKIFFYLILLTIPVLGQYSKNDTNLAKTTFYREYSPKIIEPYLSSNDSAKVNAVLLSLANSGDIKWTNRIIS